MIWEDIKNDWLLDVEVDYSPEEVVKAFNEVQSTLSLDLSLATHVGRGLVFVIPIIELGKLLPVLKEISNCSILLQKIRDNNPFQFPQTNKHGNFVPGKTDSAAEYSHALQVAQLAVHYKNHLFEVEIEPQLAVNKRIRSPDLRVRINSKWVYVEVVSPDYSKQVREAYQTLQRINQMIIGLRNDILVEVYLFRDPSEEEIVQIIEKCKTLTMDPVKEEFTFDGLSKIFVSLKNEEQLPNFPPAVQEQRPILVSIGFHQANENGTVHFSRVITKMPITDERAQLILNDKSRQLSRTDPGLIVIDVSSIPGGFKRWPYLISARLQPKLNRRINAVLIVQNEISVKKMITKKMLIRHPNPIHQLPEQFFEITSAIS